MLTKEESECKASYECLPEHEITPTPIDGQILIDLLKDICLAVTAETLDDSIRQGYEILTKLHALDFAQEQVYQPLFSFHDSLEEGMARDCMADIMDFVVGYCAPQRHIWRDIMLEHSFETKNKLFEKLLSMTASCDCEAIADFVFHLYCDMPTAEEERLGLTGADKDMLETLIAMDAGEEFWLSVDEMNGLIKRCLNA